jgi:Rrf2 family protein
MKLQVATRIALYAVLDLAADPSRQLSGAEIAERFDVSGHHLAKVLRTLGRAGLVEALRGAGGGYRFRGNVKRITLLDVIQLFEEVGPRPEDDREAGADTAEGGALRRVLEEIEHTARSTLSSITLATMLKLVEQARREQSGPAAGGDAVKRAVGQLGR